MTDGVDMSAQARTGLFMGGDARATVPAQMDTVVTRMLDEL